MSSMFYNNYSAVISKKSLHKIHYRHFCLASYNNLFRNSIEKPSWFSCRDVPSDLFPTFLFYEYLQLLKSWTKIFVIDLLFLQKLIYFWLDRSYFMLPHRRVYISGNVPNVLPRMYSSSAKQTSKLDLLNSVHDRCCKAILNNDTQVHVDTRWNTHPKFCLEGEKGFDIIWWIFAFGLLQINHLKICSESSCWFLIPISYRQQSKLWKTAHPHENILHISGSTAPCLP